MDNDDTHVYTEAREKLNQLPVPQCDGRDHRWIYDVTIDAIVCACGAVVTRHDAYDTRTKS